MAVDLPMNPDRTWLTVDAVAEQMSICERHVRRLVAAGTLPSIKLGRSVRVPSDAVDIAQSMGRL